MVRLSRLASAFGSRDVVVRLLLPTVHAAAWLPEIQTGTRAIIEPPVRQGYPNHIDIVFDDGTDSPFSLCLDRTQQLDTAKPVGAALPNRPARCPQAKLSDPCHRQHRPQPQKLPQRGGG